MYKGISISKPTHSPGAENHWR